MPKVSFVGGGFKDFEPKERNFDQENATPSQQNVDGRRKSLRGSAVWQDGINNNLAPADINLLRTDTREWTALVGITKIIDANLAGTEDGKKCTLVLIEGDNAAGFAIYGTDRDTYASNGEGISQCSRLSLDTHQDKYLNPKINHHIGIRIWKGV